MAASTYQGSFGTGTGTSDIVVTGVGFQPVAIIFWWSGRTESTNAVGSGSHYRGFGFATSSTSRRCVAGHSTHNSASAEADGGNRDDACVAMISDAGGWDGLVDLSSMDSDGFTLSVDDAMPIDLRVNFMAIAGDVSSAAIGTFVEPSSTGTQAITGTGFLPKAAIFCQMINSTSDPPEITTDSRMAIGAAAGSTPVSYCLIGGSNDGAATMQTASYCRQGECIVGMPGGVNDINMRGHVDSWDSDGFTIQWDEVTGNNTRRVFYLALAGDADFTIGDLLTQTDTTTDIVESSFASQPSAALFFSHCKTESTSDTIQDDDNWSVGAFADNSGITMACVGSVDEDNAATSNVGYAINFDNVIVEVSTSGTVASSMQVISVESDGFTCEMTDAAASQYFVWYLAFGPAASGLSPADGDGDSDLGNETAVGEGDAITDGYQTESIDSLTASASTDMPVDGRSVIGYPEYADRTPSLTEAVSFDHDINIPSLFSGDGVLLFVSINGAQELTTPDGYSLIDSQSAFAPSLYVFWRVAGSDEQAHTVSVTCGQSRKLATHAIRIKAGTFSGSPEGSAAAFSATIHPNPSGVTPSWSNKKTLSVTALALAIAEENIISYPIGYTEGLNSATSFPGGASIATSFKWYIGDSENPSSYEITASSAYSFATILFQGSDEPLSLDAVAVAASGGVIADGECSALLSGVTVSATGESIADAAATSEIESLEVNGSGTVVDAPADGEATAILEAITANGAGVEADTFADGDAVVSIELETITANGAGEEGDTLADSNATSTLDALVVSGTGDLVALPEEGFVNTPIELAQFTAAGTGDAYADADTTATLTECTASGSESCFDFDGSAELATVSVSSDGGTIADSGYSASLSAAAESGSSDAIADGVGSSTLTAINAQGYDEEVEELAASAVTLSYDNDRRLIKTRRGRVDRGHR